MEKPERQPRNFIEINDKAQYFLEQTGANLIRTVLRGTYGRNEALRFAQDRTAFFIRTGLTPEKVVEIRLATRQFRSTRAAREILCGKIMTDSDKSIHPGHIILLSRLICPGYLISGRKSPVFHFVKTRSLAEFMAIRILFDRKDYTIDNAAQDEKKLVLGAYQERMTQILPEVFYSEIQGSMNERVIRERFQYELEYLGSRLAPETSCFRILHWKDSSLLGVGDLRLFLNETFKSSRRFPCRTLVIVSDNPEIKKLFQNSLKMFPVEVLIADSFYTGLKAIIETPENLPELAAADAPEDAPLPGETPCNITRTEIMELKNFLLIAHARERDIIEDHIDSLASNHPLRGIYRAFSGYVRQIDDLRRSEQQRNLLIRGELRKYRLLHTLETGLVNRDPNRDDTLEYLMQLLNQELELNCTSCLTISEPLQEKSIKFTKSIFSADQEDSLTGTVLPLLLGIFLASRDISVFTPDMIMTEVSLRDGSLKPWLRAFLQKRKLSSAALINYSIRGKTRLYLYCERSREPEDFPFSLFDPLIREIYEILLKWRTGTIPVKGPSLPPPLDWEETLAEFGGDSEFLTRLLRDFAQEIPERRENIRILSEGGGNEDKREDLRSCLHKTKGAAANLFCEDLRAASEDFENAVKANCPAAWDRCRVRLDRELDRLASHINQLP